MTKLLSCNKRKKGGVEKAIKQKLKGCRTKKRGKKCDGALQGFVLMFLPLGVRQSVSPKHHINRLHDFNHFKTDH